MSSLIPIAPGPTLLSSQKLPQRPILPLPKLLHSLIAQPLLNTIQLISSNNRILLQTICFPPNNHPPELAYHPPISSLPTLSARKKKTHH